MAVEGFRQFKVHKLPTVTVVREDGTECIINERDFDATKHSLKRVAPEKKPTSRRTSSAKEEKAVGDSD